MPGLWQSIWSDLLGLPTGLPCPQTGGLLGSLCGGVSPIMDAGSIVQCANRIAKGISIAGVVEAGFDTKAHPYATWALDSVLGNTFAGIARIPEDIRTDPYKTYGDIVGGGLSQGLPIVGAAMVEVGVPAATAKGLFGVATNALLAATPLGLGKLGFDGAVYLGSLAYCAAQ